MLYFSVISKRWHAGGKLLYRCQPPQHPTLICITIMVSPTGRSVRSSKTGPLPWLEISLNKGAAISQPQKRLQINVTFLRALIWTPVTFLIPLTHTLPRSLGSEYDYRAFCFTIAATSPFSIQGVNEYHLFLCSCTLASNLGRGKGDGSRLPFCINVSFYNNLSCVRNFIKISGNTSFFWKILQTKF